VVLFQLALLEIPATKSILLFKRIISIIVIINDDNIMIIVQMYLELIII